MDNGKTVINAGIDKNASDKIAEIYQTGLNCLTQVTTLIEQKTKDFC